LKLSKAYLPLLRALLLLTFPGSDTAGKGENEENLDEKH
jgi:hypothetical protein